MFPTHQPVRFWLKDEANWNIEAMPVTLDVSQLPMSWLKDVANWNIKLMFVTLDVSQLPISWLKDEAE